MPDTGASNTQQWTYPTRLCRICHEDVPATVTMYPPGFPTHLQRPIVEYKSEEEYGRLVRPCQCKGGMRYIHEHCLLQSRIHGQKWKCPTCGYQFNFQRLNVQRILETRSATVGITLLVLVALMFLLGFLADPIINLYIDPYYTITHGDFWAPVDVNDIDAEDAGWLAHFTKGFFSLGLVGFLKTLLANPWNWWNLRNTGFAGSARVRAAASGTGNTGRERAINMSWIAVLIGICSAFYFFYQWVQSIVGRTLHQLGNNIVDTHLPGDDDDIKPPEGYTPSSQTSTGSTAEPAEQEEEASGGAGVTASTPFDKAQTAMRDEGIFGRTMAGSWIPEDTHAAQSSGIDSARAPGWSFRGI